MFTGLVENLGTVLDIEVADDGARLIVETELGAQLKEGDSIAVAGVCLTATRVKPNQVAVDVIQETLARTTLEHLRSGDRVNLELALRMSDRLGGHFVQGHVDAVGEVIAREEQGFSTVLEIRCEPGLMRYIGEKGSITVDGVALTVAGLGEASFTVALIPKTLEQTTLGNLAQGAKVNIEVDVLAKYVERLLSATGVGTK